MIMNINKIYKHSNYDYCEWWLKRVKFPSLSAHQNATKQRSLHQTRYIVRGKMWRDKYSYDLQHCDALPALTLASIEPFCQVEWLGSGGGVTVEHRWSDWPAALHQLHCNSCTAPAALHQLYYTSCITPAVLHQLHCTSCIAPAALHQLHCTSCIAPAALHQLHCTSCTAPASLHQLYCTSCTAPASLHQLHCTSSTAPAAQHLLELLTNIKLLYFWHCHRFSSSSCLEHWGSLF